MVCINGKRLSPLRELMYEKIEPQRVGNRFENPWNTWGGLPDLSGLFRWYRTKKERDSLAHIDTLLPVLSNPEFQSNPSDGLIVTWLGHSTILVQMANMAFLTDPIFSDRCSPVRYIGPKRIRPPPCTVVQLPKIDAVLISHNHYDHLDLSTVKQLNNRFGASLTWFVPLGLREWFLASGCVNVIEKTWWQETNFNNADLCDKNPVKVVALPCQHWSGRSLRDRNKDFIEPKVELKRQVDDAGLRPGSFLIINQGESWKSCDSETDRPN